MKKHCSLVLGIICLQIFFPLILQAKSLTYIQAGANISSLRREKGQKSPGITFGIGNEFTPFRSFNGILGIELSYAEKKLKLENKTWPAEYDQQNSNPSIGDIPLDRSYLEFSFKMGYCFKPFRNETTIQIFGGPAISIPIKYSSFVFSDSTIFLNPDDRGKFKFDYSRCESESADNYLNSFIGIAVMHHNFGVELLYESAVSPQYCIRGLTINDALDSIHLLLRYSF